MSMSRLVDGNYVFSVSGIHRQLSMPTSKIRSLRLDYKVWTPGLINVS